MGWLMDTYMAGEHATAWRAMDMDMDLVGHISKALRNRCEHLARVERAGALPPWETWVCWPNSLLVCGRCGVSGITRAVSSVCPKVIQLRDGMKRPDHPIFATLARQFEPF